jgi:hypothetical protein
VPFGTRGNTDPVLTLRWHLPPRPARRQLKGPLCERRARDGSARPEVEPTRELTEGSPHRPRGRQGLGLVRSPHEVMVQDWIRRFRAGPPRTWNLVPSDRSIRGAHRNPKNDLQPCRGVRQLSNIRSLARGESSDQPRGICQAQPLDQPKFPAGARLALVPCGGSECCIRLLSFS